MKRELKDISVLTHYEKVWDTEPFPMKRELKEIGTGFCTPPDLGYRTIPYEEGTESLFTKAKWFNADWIQNHSLWRGNWKWRWLGCRGWRWHDTEPFPMKRELKATYSSNHDLKLWDTEPFPMKRELKGNVLAMLLTPRTKIQNHSLWRGNWKSV